MRVNPPLVYSAAAVVPLLVLPDLKEGVVNVVPRGRYEYGLGTRLVIANQTNPWRLFALARCSCIPLSLLGAYVCLRWADSIYGAPAGTLALFLWCGSPNVLGYSSIAVADGGAAATGAAAGYVFWRWLKRPSWAGALGAGLVLGLAELTKTTWIVLFGLWPVLWIVWRWAEPRAEGGGEKGKEEGETGNKEAKGRWAPQAWQMGLILVLGLYVLNLGYGFEGSFQKLGEYGFVSETLGGPTEDGRTGYSPQGRNRFEGTWLAGVPVPLPKNYLMGIDLQRGDFERKMWSYLRGEWRMGGWWYYYLYALAIKVPLGTWVLVLLAAGVSLWPGGRCPPAIARPSPLAPGEVVAPEVATPNPSPLAPGEVVPTEVATPRPSRPAPNPSGYSAGWRDELVLLAPAAVVLTLVSSQTGFNHHLRYVLPIFPFVFIWMSKLARAVDLKHWKIASIAAVALLWSVGSSLYYYPHSLSYFNELVGGPTGGHYHLAGSNVDWGQDLFYLKGWLDEHPDARPLTLAYGMPPVDLKLAGVEYVGRPPAGSPEPGWHAVSVNQIHNRSGKYEYFLSLKPVGMAGYSIYIYHVTLDEANRVRRELELTELPQDWQRPGGGDDG